MPTESYLPKSRITKARGWRKLKVDNVGEVIASFPENNFLRCSLRVERQCSIYFFHLCLPRCVISYPTDSFTINKTYPHSLLQESHRPFIYINVNRLLLIKHFKYITIIVWYVFFNYQWKIKLNHYLLYSALEMVSGSLMADITATNKWLHL